jgi:hypothetical protein
MPAVKAKARPAGSRLDASPSYLLSSSDTSLIRVSARARGLTCLKLISPLLSMMTMVGISMTSKLWLGVPGVDPVGTEPVPPGLQLLHRVARAPGGVDADGDHHQLLPELPSKLHEVHHRRHARAAPGGHEVEEDNPTLEVAQPEGFAVDVHQGEVVCAPLWLENVPAARDDQQQC